MAEYLNKQGSDDSRPGESYGSNVTTLPQKPEVYQRKWIKEIERATRYFKDWEQKGEKTIRLYRKQGMQTSSKRRFAMLWANTEVMKPTIYAKVPEPVIGRRYKDKDVPGRVASDIMERAASYIFDKANFDMMMKGVRDDLLLPGRGTCWVRFVGDGVIALDYVHWRDYLHQPARRWEEVTWVAHRSYMDKTQMRQRFELSADELRSMSPDNVPQSGISEDERKALEGKYTVWEIWDKTNNLVCFISPTATKPLEISEPFLTLESFWPSPRPIWATLTTDSLIPVQDYKYYQDQAEEIDDLTRRIGALTDGLKLVGFYPKGSEAATEIEQALKPSVENRMIGVEAWAAFAEKGGVKSIVFLPIEEVVATIKACVELRTQLIQDVYQITGLSDIMRGQTDPNETLGAQELKAQTGSVRVRDRQQEIQRFAKDVLNIVCEIVAEKFSPQMLLQMTNMITEENSTPEMQNNLMQAFQLMRSDQLRGFRIDIETDSTVHPDENAEKQHRIEFATAMGNMFKEAVPLVEQAPMMLPLVGETIRFVVRGFRAGKELEDVLDKTLKAVEQEMAQKKQNQQPTPDQQKVMIDAKRVEEVEKPKAIADANLANARAAHLHAQAAAIPVELGMKQDQMILGDAQATADREQQGQQAEADRQQAGDQFDATQAQDADQFDATQQQQGDQFEAEQQAAATAGDQQMQMAAMKGGGTGAGSVPTPPAASMGPPGVVAPNTPGASPAQSPMQGAVAQLLQALAASTMQNSQAIQQLAAVMAAPTVVQTPRGTYTARKMIGGQQ